MGGKFRNGLLEKSLTCVGVFVLTVELLCLQSIQVLHFQLQVKELQL